MYPYIMSFLSLCQSFCHFSETSTNFDMKGKLSSETKWDYCLAFILATYSCMCILILWIIKADKEKPFCSKFTIPYLLLHSNKIKMLSIREISYQSGTMVTRTLHSVKNYSYQIKNGQSIEFTQKETETELKFNFRIKILCFLVKSTKL